MCGVKVRTQHPRVSSTLYVFRTARSNSCGVPRFTAVSWLFSGRHPSIAAPHQVRADDDAGVAVLEALRRVDTARLLEAGAVAGPERGKIQASQRNRLVFRLISREEPVRNDFGPL